jgi:hypothetical protein
MKKLLTTFYTLCISSLSFAQVGIGTTTPASSAILDLTTTNKALLLTRVANTAAIATPSNGMMIYDLSSNCTKIYQNDAWSGCLVATSNSTVADNCDINGFEGAYAIGFAMTAANKFTVTVTNNSFTTASLSFAIGDLVLSGVTGLTVSAVSPATATLIAGQSQLVTYTLTGTPTTIGDLTGTWTKSSLSCDRTKEVTGISGLVNSNYCTNATVNGTYISAVAFTAANTFAVTLTNTTGVAITGMPAPTIANLTRSFSGTGTINVASVSPSAAFNLAIGASQTITYTLSGTPTSTGVLSLDWAYGDLTCAKTKNVELGNATFGSDLAAYVFSANDTSIPINVQGTMATGTTGNMAYTAGLGSYIAYTSPDISIPAAYCEDGASDWTFGYSYTAGTFASSGNIPVTYITKKAGVITPWPALRVSLVSTINFNISSVPWIINGNTYSKNILLHEGGDAIRGGIAVGGGASAAAYDAAPVNTYVQITAAEYTGCQTIVSGNAKYGAVDTRMSVFTPDAGWGAGFTTIASEAASNKTIPINTYLFGFAVNVFSTAAAADGIIFKTTTADPPSSGLSDLLPTVAATPSNLGNTKLYYVIKRPTNKTSATLKTFIGFYTSSKVTVCLDNTGGETGVYWVSGNSSTLNTALYQNSQPRIQTLGTTLKQW